MTDNTDSNEKPREQWTAREHFDYAATGVAPTIPKEDPMNNDAGDFGGLDFSEFKKHPVRRLLYGVQAGDRPSRADLDALELPVASRRQLAEAVKELRQLRDDGENGEAEKRFDRLAAEVIAGLPKDLREPSYFDPPDDEPSDPAALAAQVSRW